MTDDILAARLCDRRKELVLQFAALPGDGSVIDLQREIRAEIEYAERQKSGPDRAEYARHRRLLRSIGDGIAYQLLSDHTIRTLARHPGPPAGLSSQGADLDFVLELAQSLEASGFVPIICDLTHLLGVGDLIVVARDHVVILECKNTTPPAGREVTGRLARQQERGDNAARYLRDSELDEGAQVRIAVNFRPPEVDWNLLTELGSEAASSPRRGAVAELGEGDWMMLATSGADLDSLFDEIRGLPKSAKTVIGFHTENTRNPLPWCPNVTTFPLAPSLRHDLLEGTAVLMRIIDVSKFAAQRTTADREVVAVLVREKSGEPQLSLSVADQELSMSRRFLDCVMYLPISVEAMRNALLDHAESYLPPAQKDLTADAASAQELGPDKAPGDLVSYGTVYRSDEGEPVIVLSSDGSVFSTEGTTAYGETP